MMNLLYFINWNPNLELFRIGPFSARYYGVCWIMGLALGYFIVKWLYEKQKIKPELFDPLFTYCFLGIFIGARLGHCLFYDFGYFSNHLIEMFLPIREVFDPNHAQWFLGWIPCTHGGCGWDIIGYQGLASHGGTIGIIIALLLYVRWSKLNVMRVLDNIAIATPVTACFIRLGNLMNSEIIGCPTNVPWAFIFHRVDEVPRHPGQLYEAIAYFIILLAGLYLYKKHEEKVGTGFFFGFCLASIFTFRFFVEYVKEVQEDFENGMLFDMGQILSIPFIIIGFYCMFGGSLCKKLGEKK